MSVTLSHHPQLALEQSIVQMSIRGGGQVIVVPSQHKYTNTNALPHIARYKHLNTSIMPHSKSRRNQRARLVRDLDKRIHDLAQLRVKHFTNAQRISLTNVSIGDLRARWSLVQKGLHPAVLRQVPKFTRIPSNPHQPLLIYGSDGGLLAARVRSRRPDLIQNLSTTIDTLPLIKHYKHKGVPQSEYQTRHLGIWAPYMTTPEYTAEHRENRAVHDQFLKDNAELFRDMSGFMGQLIPGVFKEFLRYPLRNGHKRPCGAWASCVVNNGGNNPNQTNIHRDVKESQFRYSCVVSCGDYTGGDIHLYDLNYTLEMAPGDFLLFPDSIIHHANEAAEGTRKSVVTFTQENIFDFWRRKYEMRLKRHVAKEKRESKKKDQKAREKLMKKQETDRNRRLKKK